MATPAGLEPAISSVTGWRINPFSLGAISLSLIFYNNYIIDLKESQKFYVGGGCGTRTHTSLRTTGFLDRGSAKYA